MGIFLRVLSLLMSFLFAFGGTPQSVIGFTEGEPLIVEKRDYCFDNDRLLIGAYYADADHVKEASEAGIEFFIDNKVNEAFLDECRKYGIGVIANGYNLPGFYGALDAGGAGRWADFDYAGYKDHPALWGDDLIDEPNADSFDAIADALNAYHANTTGKIGLVNLFPSYANEDQLTEYPERTPMEDFWLGKTGAGSYESESYKMYISDYINKVPADYICADIYPYRSRQNGLHKEVKSTIRDWLFNLDVMAEACRETGRDMWIITQAAGETEKGESDGNHPRYCDEVSDISQQCYACLAFGAGAIIHAQFAARGWWDPEYSHMIDVNGNTTATYDAVKTVDGYLAAFADVYGKYTYESTYLRNPLLVAGRNDLTLAVTDPAKAADIRSLNGLLVGTFTSEDGKAYVVTNMEELNRNVTAVFSYRVPFDKTVTVYKQGRELNYMSGAVATISLEPGEGVFITEQKAEWDNIFSFFDSVC